MTMAYHRRSLRDFLNASERLMQERDLSRDEEETLHEMLVRLAELPGAYTCQTETLTGADVSHRNR